MEESFLDLIFSIRDIKMGLCHIYLFICLCVWGGRWVVAGQKLKTRYFSD